MKTRTEKDSLGAIKVPADKLWGAQTQRALSHFASGAEIMPAKVIWALALCKKAAALTNKKLKAQLAAYRKQMADKVKNTTITL